MPITSIYRQTPWMTSLTIVGRGSFKGALSFDVITSLGLEIVTQLEEETSTRPVLNTGMR
jgi:hypothetical protein